MDLVNRFIRVLVAGIWGWLAMMALKYLGVEFSAEQAAAIQSALTVVFAAMANVLIGYAAKQWPGLEWLLGVGIKPVYKVEQK